jgi:hypothetical protein
MNRQQAFILVYSTSHAIRIEKLLKESGLSCKLVPVPRRLSSDCGVCVRIDQQDLESAKKIVENVQVEIEDIYVEGVI